MAYYSNLLPSYLTRKPQPDFPRWLPPRFPTARDRQPPPISEPGLARWTLPMPEQRQPAYPGLLGMGPEIPVVPGYTTWQRRPFYPGLLGMGSPYPSTGTVFPFADQHTPVGTLPIAPWTAPPSVDPDVLPPGMWPAPPVLPPIPPPGQAEILGPEGDTEVYSWGNTNEYNPPSIPATRENVMGALFNLASGPVGVLGNLAVHELLGTPMGVDDPRSTVSTNLLSGRKADYPGPESRLVSHSVEGGGAIYPEQPGMGRVTVTPLAPPQLVPQWDSYLTTEDQRQENLRAAQQAILGTDYAPEWGGIGGWDSGDWSEEDEGDMPEDDPTDDDYASF